MNLESCLGGLSSKMRFGVSRGGKSLERVILEVIVEWDLGWVGVEAEGILRGIEWHSSALESVKCGFFHLQ